MARLVATAGWTVPGSVAAYLRETLPDEYVVVADPIIARTPVACVVAGRTGLFIIHCVGGPADEERGAAVGASSPAGNGVPVEGKTAREETDAALSLFLRDEFPTLRLAVRHMETLRDWAAELPTWRILATPEQGDDLLSEVIEAQDVDGANSLPADAVLAIGIALRDRQFTASQRALKPFVFRSGGMLRVGRPVWTLREVVDHLERYPADGIHHLRNGTLAEWLDEEGATHLAELARSAMDHPGIDMRAGLETFLLGTGLVSRPLLRASPQRLDLGYAIEGRAVASVLRLSAGKGRGYLYGQLSTSEPWLQVTPASIKGKQIEAVVSADTSGLRIRPNPIEGLVLVKSSASDQAITVPVVLRVMPLPSPLSRALFRPLAGLLASAPVGALIGWLCARAGLSVSHMTGTAAPILLCLALWSLAGSWRGMRQPAAWPIAYALRRWLQGSATWSLLLGGVSALLAWSWTHGLGAGLGWNGPNPLHAGLVGAAAGCLPALLCELATSGLVTNVHHVIGRRSSRRIAALSAALACLLTLAMLAPRVLSPIAQRMNVNGAMERAQVTMNAGLESLQDIVDQTVDRVTLKLYDRRAPFETGTAPDGQQAVVDLPRLPLLRR